MSDSIALAIKPIVRYPRIAQVGKTYLMTIDLEVEPGAEWNYDEEEYPVYCEIDSELFKTSIVGEPVIVLHRFGGSYGKAQFLLKSVEAVERETICITLVNRYGVSIKSFNLKNIQILEEVEQMGDVLSNSQINSSVPIEVSLDDIKSKDSIIQINTVSTHSFQRTETPNNVPRSGISQFIGREMEIEQLHALFQQKSLSPILAIEGMGGVGKTELAIQYAQRFASSYLGGVCWLSARDFNVGTQIVGFAQSQLNLTIPEGLELSNQVAFCWQNWIEGDVLLILDDVINYRQDIEPYLPPQIFTRFKMIMTTRLKFGPPVQSLSLDVLSIEQSLELLTSLLGEVRVQQELDIATSLCYWLEGLPLAIELVGHYSLERRELSLSMLLSHLQEKAQTRQAIKHAAINNDENIFTSTGKRGAESAFELSWEELDDNSQHLGMLLSLFASAPIPWYLAEEVEHKYCENLDDGRSFETSELEEARYVLVKFHLLQVLQQEEQLYKFHPLIREFFRGKLEENENPELIKLMQEKICNEMIEKARAIPQVITISLINSIAPIIPHLVEISTFFHDLISDSDLIISPTRIAWFYQGQGAYKEAENWYLQCLKISESRLGSEHIDVAVSLNNLAAFYEFQGRYNQAEPLYIRSVSTLQRNLSNQHPEVASSMNNLAELYRSQGRYDEAEKLHKVSLSIRQQQLGNNHPDTAISMNNLAALYYMTARFEESQSLMEQALFIRRSLLGFDHPDIAISLNNLGLLYQRIGKHDEAELAILDSLGIRRRILGNHHPDTAASLSNLAGLYQTTQRYDEAESLMRQVLAIYQEQLGYSHPDTAASLNNLGELYRLTGRFSEAKPLYENALSTYQDALGNSHPTTISTRNNLLLLKANMELTNTINQEIYDDILIEPLESTNNNLSSKSVSTIDLNIDFSVDAILSMFSVSANSEKYDLIERFTQESIVKIVHLRQIILTHFNDRDRVLNSLSLMEQGDLKAQVRCNLYLEDEMKENSEFAIEIQNLIRQIKAGELHDSSSMTQNNRDNARGWQTIVQGNSNQIGEIIHVSME